MEKIINFQECKEQNIAEKREMLDRLRDHQDESLDELQDNFIEEMEVIDPKLASMMKESVQRSGSALIGKMRMSGMEIPGTDFEKKRNERDLAAENKLDCKIEEHIRQQENKRQ